MSSVIETKSGPVEGFHHNGCTNYLGIPFARPPVGKLAFRHPLPPEPWQDVLKADKGSPNPVQAAGGFFIGNNSQDCLYLNIFVPDGNPSPMPVMVWFYGGSYSQGGAGAYEKDSDHLIYDLSRFAKETGCVVVSFNYRLNLYGFLNLHFLAEHFDMNNGLYDQIMALRFVKENIGAFGGDADNITLFGQSAGGACILALMTMKEADGLYNKTIVQSACIEHFFTEEESRAFTRKYLKFAGVRTASELKSLDIESVRRANRRYSDWLLRHGEIRCAFSPVIDGETLPIEPKEAVKKSKVPMMIGNTSEEANLFLSSFPGFVMPFVSKYIHLDVKKGPGSYKQRASDALTDHIYIRPQLEILKEYSGSAWRYEYQHVQPGEKRGCFHASEVPVLFGMDLMGINGSTDDTGVTLRSVWSRFAHEGNPGWQEGSTHELI